MEWELKKDFTISEIKEICKKNDWALCGHTQSMIINKCINKFIERYGDKHLPLKIIKEFYTKKTEDNEVKVGDLCYFYDDEYKYYLGVVGFLESIKGNDLIKFKRLGGSDWQYCEPIKTHIKKLKKLCKESESKKNCA
jgi:DNA-binding transcriptional MerR regulator